MKKNTNFIGPVFIVGMPRSGTKLLRDILNNHSLIAITPNESHCIPYFHKIINKYGNLSSPINFERFYTDFSKTNFFQILTQEDKFIDRTSWYNAVGDWSYAGIIEAFYRIYATWQGKRIWGDKTPMYLIHLPLLYYLFPKAKVIHIIRDPRDYCVSINYAWGKNIYRAAQSWANYVSKCRKTGYLHGKRSYYEVKYESLTGFPIQILEKICGFLNIDFEEDMLRFNAPPENIGNAKGVLHIVDKNYGKWTNRLESSQILRIEKLCCSLMRELGYSSGYQGNVHTLNTVEMWLYKLSDGLNIIRYVYSSQKSFLKASKSMMHAWKTRAQKGRTDY